MSGLARRLDRLQRRDSRRFAKKLTGQQLAVVSLLSPLEALVDQRISAGVVELLRACRSSATGEIARRDCFCCGRAWSCDRAPALVIIVEYPQLARAIAGGICMTCSHSAELRELIIAGLEASLGGTATRIVHVAEAGHA